MSKNAPNRDPHVRETRFKELGFIKMAPDLWRIVDTETGAVMGPQYKSRSELLCDLERYAREYGLSV